MNIFQNILFHILPKYRERIYSRYLSGETPIFSQFGNDVYVSDIVRQGLKAIAIETSKISLKSVIEDTAQNTVSVEQDSITQLFKYKPNPLMTAQEFWYKVAWLRKVNLNAFIYPTYKNINGKRIYTAFYPLNPNQVEFLSDENSGQLFIKMGFEFGESYILPYNDIIHLRDDFTINNLVGGDLNGQPDNSEIIKTATILDKVMQCMPKAVIASLSIRGVLVAKSSLATEMINSERERLEKQIESSNSGIIATGLDGDFKPMNISPSLIPKDTLDWLENKILRNYGVSMAIVTGDFTEQQSSAFYQKCIEDFVIQAEQAFTPCLYSGNQIAKGHKIKIYDRLIQHLSMQTRLKITELYVPTGYLDEDEARELIGYEPRGRKRNVMSLNYIDVAIASEYQLSAINGKKEERTKQNE